MRGVVRAEALDVSRDGLFVRPLHALAMHTTVSFSSILDDGEAPIVGRGRVVRHITDAEAPLLVRSLLSAGLDTTVYGIGAAIYCLARFPNQMARLRADPSLARNAFEERIASANFLSPADRRRIANLMAA